MYTRTHTGDATVVKCTVAEENAGLLPQQKTPARCVVPFLTAATVFRAPIDECEALDKHASDLVGHDKVPARRTIGQKLVLIRSFSLAQFMVNVCAIVTRSTNTSSSDDLDRCWQSITVSNAPVDVAARVTSANRALGQVLRTAKFGRTRPALGEWAVAGTDIRLSGENREESSRCSRDTRRGERLLSFQQAQPPQMPSSLGLPG